jgi:hypothetical protein
MSARSTTASIIIDRRAAGAAKIADRQDPALCEKDRASRRLGRTLIAGGNQYRAKSAAGKVRHPFFKGIREDL